MCEYLSQRATFIIIWSILSGALAWQAEHNPLAVLGAAIGIGALLLVLEENINDTMLDPIVDFLRDRE